MRFNTLLLVVACHALAACEADWWPGQTLAGNFTDYDLAIADQTISPPEMERAPQLLPSAEFSSNLRTMKSAAAKMSTFGHMAHDIHRNFFVETTVTQGVNAESETLILLDYINDGLLALSPLRSLQLNDSFTISATTARHAVKALERYAETGALDAKTPLTLLGGGLLHLSSAAAKIENAHMVYLQHGYTLREYRTRCRRLLVAGKLPPAPSSSTTSIHALLDELAMMEKLHYADDAAYVYFSQARVVREEALRRYEDINAVLEGDYAQSPEPVLALLRDIVIRAQGEEEEAVCRVMTTNRTWLEVAYDARDYAWGLMG